jgi:hypothetical protein
MKQDLLSFMDDVGVVGVVMLMLMNGDGGGEEGLYLLNVGLVGHMVMSTPCLQPVGLETSYP